MGLGLEKNVLARRLMAFYNRKGIFDNQQDNVTDLRAALREYFSHVSI